MGVNMGLLVPMHFIESIIVIPVQLVCQQLTVHSFEDQRKYSNYFCFSFFILRFNIVLNYYYIETSIHKATERNYSFALNEKHCQKSRHAHAHIAHPMLTAYEL